jgi:hypothetical protein
MTIQPEREQTETHSFLPGAAWLEALARANAELPTPELLKLLRAEVEMIRANPHYLADEGRLVCSDTEQRRRVQALMSQAYRVRLPSQVGSGAEAKSQVSRPRSDETG